MAVDRYAGMGLKKSFLNSFLIYPDNQWEKDSYLSSKQKVSLAHWLIDAELIERRTKRTTLLGKYLQIIASEIMSTNQYNLILAVIWTNLYYNSEIVKWFCDNIDWGSSFTKQEMIDKMALFYPTLKKSTIRNSINALINTLKSFSWGLGVFDFDVSEKGRIKSVIKKGTDNVPNLVVAYSLYKMSEYEGKKSYTVSQLYDKKSNGGPYKLFGISKERLEKKLRSLQEDNILAVDLVADLDNIFLQNFSALTIVKLILF